MRSFVASFFALASLAALVFANPEPAPEPHKPVIIRPPPPLPCSLWVYGTCPSGQTCQTLSVTPRAKTYGCKPNTPVPSGKLSHPKRSAFCEENAVACPVPGELHGFECINVSNNLEQCGDCAVLGGVDCSALPGVGNVACVNGACRVDSCISGFAFDFRKRTCVPAGLWNVHKE
ncbi:hypothetical protein JCM16303_002526 [Sporobolomyces ruberrimus]